MMKPDQLEAAARIQAALLNIENLRTGINRLAKASGLKIRALHIPALGFLLHDIEGALFDHSVALHKEIDRNEQGQRMQAAA